VSPEKLERACPNCETILDPDQTSCFMCGTKIIEDKVATVEKGDRVCSNCETILDPDQTICFVCETEHKDEEQIRKRNLEEKLKIYTMKLKDNPRDVKLWYAKASIFIKLENYVEALIVSNVLEKIVPNDPNVWYLKAGIFSKIRERKRAAYCKQKAIELSKKRKADIAAKEKLRPVPKRSTKSSERG
jgi:RNA polymerase subunit RPABC4/transcription elongation factor Spt4